MYKIVFHGESIRTKYLGPTNFRGSRISARGNWDGEDGRKERITINYRSELESSENHVSAALKLAETLGWKWDPKEIHSVDSPDGGYIFFAVIK